MNPKTGKLWNPRQILGALPGTTDRPPYYNPAAWPDIRARMAEKGFWPLYEGKHIEQFLIDIKPIERWVSLEAAEKKNGRLPDPGPKLVFRDIARNTDERTCISAVLPDRSCSGNTLALIKCDNINPKLIVSLLNSIPIDFSIRLRIAATHLNFTYMTRLAVLGISDVKNIGAVNTISAVSFSADHISGIQDIWPDIWFTNRSIAEAYGLTPDEFEYILSTFPVFARKRPDFFAYLQQRIAEWKSEEGIIARRSRTYITPPEHTSISRAAEEARKYRKKARN